MDKTQQKGDAQTKPCNSRKGYIAVCEAGKLHSSGLGLRFTLCSSSGDEITGFVIRYRGTAYAYRNECQHMQVELDWNPGVFFDQDGRYLMCATHGALYDPENGRCVAGPCIGATLYPLEVYEDEHYIYVNSKC